MNYKIICDFSENYDSKTDIEHINDHQTRETFLKINESIKELGYNCDIFGGVPELIKACNGKYPINKDDIFINLSDGTNSRYSRVQIPILCDLLKLKYSGGGTFETALTTNKYYSSLAVRTHGFMAPKSYLIDDIENFRYVSKGKYIIKPNSEGSSVGITDKSVCNTLLDAKKQVEYLFEAFSEVLIEEYISGYDATCFIIGNEIIHLCEPLLIKHHDKIIFDNEVMGYKDHVNKTRHFISCNNVIPNNVIDKIKKISVQIKDLFKIKDFCRIDYRITPDYDIYFLEINTVPAISMESQVGVICNSLNISFKEFLNKIVVTLTDRINHE